MLRYVSLVLAVVVAVPTLLFFGTVAFLWADEHYTLKECRVAEEAQFEWFVFRCEHLWWSWQETDRHVSFDDYWPARLPIWAAKDRCRDEVRTRVAKEHCDRKFDPHAPRI